MREHNAATQPFLHVHLGLVKATYVSSCGADAVYVIQHNKWLEQPLARQMSGDCWKKGSLNIAR